MKCFSEIVMKIDILTMQLWNDALKIIHSVVSSSNINIFIKVQLLDNTFLAGFFFVIPGNL